MLGEESKTAKRRKKMTKVIKKERRHHPRLEQELPVNIAANGYDFTTATQNISCLGAYCHIDKYVPPFTKIAIKLSLPMFSENGSQPCAVECNGVIVRTEDDKKGGFNVAIFFNKIGNSQRQKISQYINQFLSSNNSSSPR